MGSTWKLSSYHVVTYPTPSMYSIEDTRCLEFPLINQINITLILFKIECVQHDIQAQATYIFQEKENSNFVYEKTKLHSHLLEGIIAAFKP